MEEEGWRLDFALAWTAMPKFSGEIIENLILIPHVSK